MAQQPGIVIFRQEYANVRDKLNHEQKGQLLDALFDFSESGIEYQGNDPFVSMAFAFFSAAIQRYDSKYAERCRKNRENAQRRWNNDEDAIESDGMRLHAIACDACQQNENESSETNPPKRIIFSPPTLADVSEYIRERGCRIDPGEFIDFYQARGWQLKAGVKMKDWKAAVRTWERKRGEWNRGLYNSRNGDQAPGQRSEYKY